ncbi:MAG: hypothetical protein QOJ46_772 [bacterium]
MQARRIAGIVVRVATVLVLLVALVVVHEIRAVRGAARAGERALVAAGVSMRAGQPAAARRHATGARQQFARARGDIASLRGWLGALGTIAPVDDQLHALDVLAQAGHAACAAASRIAAGAAPVATHRAASSRPLIGDMRRMQDALSGAETTLTAAIGRIDAVRRSSLVGPVGTSVTRARRELAHARGQAVAGGQALSAAIAFAGGTGPRRYLLLSQNPAELRPTGGFIGSYGVLVVRNGQLRLTRYRSIESWYFKHRRAIVPAAAAPRALRLPSKPIAQTLANANAAGDWPAAARLASRLWRDGGEAPVDGVISFTPALVARMLAALGPQRVPGYREVVTSTNVVALLDRYTHTGARARRIDRRPFGSLRAAAARKRFIGLLAARLMRRVNAAPTRSLSLARAIVRGLDLREGMAWSSDPALASVLRARRWDGAVPAVSGDYAYDGEFQYAVKNGQGLHRRFDHDVELHADGSARITTTVTVANTLSNGMDSYSYMTLYGPRGATLLPESDPPTGGEPSIAGHPAAGWLRDAPSWGTASLRVIWQVPDLLIRRDRRLIYKLLWMHIPAHRGDVLNLRVTPPRGWRWATRPPPATHRLSADVQGAWSLTRADR